MDIVLIVVFIIAICACSYLLGAYTTKTKMIAKREEEEKEKEKEDSKKNLIGKIFTLDAKEEEIDLYSDEKLSRTLCQANGGAQAMIISSYREQPDDEYYLSFEIDVISSKGHEVTAWIPSFLVDADKLQD